MKNLIIILIFISLTIIAQEEPNRFGKRLNGIIQTPGEIIFIIDDEYYKLESNDYYEEYYRTIYNDSTIVNPNTEIKSNFNLTTIPFIDLGSNNFKSHFFDVPIQFGMFIEVNENGNFNLTQYGSSFIDSLLKN